MVLANSKDPTDGDSISEETDACLPPVIDDGTASGVRQRHKTLPTTTSQTPLLDEQVCQSLDVGPESCE